MNLLTFETLKVEGFGTIQKHKVFKLNNPGLNIIRGLNGAGKTTWFSALAWCLYQKPLKPGSTAETWEHLRGEDWSGTMVSVSFVRNTTKYKVTRCKDYKRVIGGLKGGNRLIFEKEGEPVNIKDKRDVQTLIEETLGITFSLFTNSVVFQQKGVRFIEQPGPDKKKILEESFKLTWISQAMDLAKDEKAEFESKLYREEKDLASINTQLDDYNRILLEMWEHRKAFEEDKKKALEKLAKRKEEITKALEEQSKWDAEITPKYGAKEKALEEIDLILKDRSRTDFMAELLSAQSNYQKTRQAELQAKNTVKRIDSELVTLMSKITKFKGQKEKVCPVCTSILGVKETAATIKSLKAERDELEVLKAIDIQALEKLTQIAEQDLDKVKKDHNRVNDLDSMVATLNTEITLYRNKSIQNESNKGMLLEIEDRILIEEGKEFKDSSQTIRNNLLVKEKEKEETEFRCLKWSQKVDVCSWAIRGPLSNSGIKSYLFDKLLSQLNQALRYYESFTGFSIKLLVDMESGWKNIEAIVSYAGAPVDFKDLSGGESQLVNVIIALASSDVLLADTRVNIRIFDEVSEHLDDPTTELLGGFLKKLSESHAVFIITHNRHLNVSGANEIHIKKDE